MTNIETTYMGIPLKSPIIVGASSISSMLDRIQKAEEHGAGALVIRSLYEEQAYNRPANDDQSETYFPSMDHHTVKDHLHWTEKTREAVKMPLIGSLNAVQKESWVKFAQALENTGVNALELNIYSIETNRNRPGTSVEQEIYETLENVKGAVKIPVSVKMGAFFTSVANVAAELDRRKANGLVLFNRFLQPDIDLDTMSLTHDMPLSSPDEIKLPLRWTAILYGRVYADIALSTGVHTGKDVIKALLAGAQVTQTAAALLQHGIQHLDTMHAELTGWMSEKGYQKIEDFRGKLSQQNVADPQAFERAQYVQLMLSQR